MTKRKATEPAPAGDDAVIEWAAAARESEKTRALLLRHYAEIDAALAAGASLRTLAERLGRNRESVRRAWQRLRADVEAGRVVPPGRATPRHGEASRKDQAAGSAEPAGQRQESANDASEAAAETASGAGSPAGGKYRRMSEMDPAEIFKRLEVK